MSSIDYTPSGTAVYECQLTTDLNGWELTVSSNTDDGDESHEGDEQLKSNPALLNLLRAYGTHEWHYRRLRALEKRGSHQKLAEKYLREACVLADMAERVIVEESAGGWCSACLTSTEHVQVAGMARPRQTYLCDNCGAPTTPCFVPGCSHFASRGLRRIATPKYCAEHTHEIPSFEKLTRRLAALDDYAAWLEFEKRNASRVTKIASITVAGGAVLAPVAFIAAPAIGGAVGTLSGLSGAAATSQGLALLGGGSMAAGGLGMAGGTAVVTALGGGLGAALGATTTSAYVRNDPSFRIECLREGEGTPVLFATGFLTEGQSRWGGWRSLIDNCYPEAPVYRVHWGAKELSALSWAAGKEAGRRLARQAVIEMAAKAGKKAAARIGPLGAVFLANGIAKNPWTLARSRAEMTGAILADLIARTDQERFILIGHSLGGRVMVSTGQILGTRDEAPKIEAIHLLGAAVSAGADWQTLNESVTEAVWNYYSKNDVVLARLYRATALGRPAVGRVGFESSFDKIRDRNVSRQVSSHTAYVTKVKLVCPEDQ